MGRISGKLILSKYEPGVRKHDFLGEYMPAYTRVSDFLGETNSRNYDRDKGVIKSGPEPKILYYVESDSNELKRKETLLLD